MKIRIFGHGGHSVEQVVQVEGTGGIFFERILTPDSADGRLDFGYANAFYGIAAIAKLTVT